MLLSDMTKAGTQARLVDRYVADNQLACVGSITQGEDCGWAGPWLEVSQGETLF